MAIITDKERIDEALELIWVLAEEGHKELERFNLSSDDADTPSMIETMIEDGLIVIDEGNIVLTDKGHKTARGLIRRQRLAERLFSDVFEMPDDRVLDDVCYMVDMMSVVL